MFFGFNVGSIVVSHFCFWLFFWFLFCLSFVSRCSFVFFVVLLVLFVLKNKIRCSYSLHLVSCCLFGLFFFGILHFLIYGYLSKSISPKFGDSVNPKSEKCRAKRQNSGISQKTTPPQKKMPQKLFKTGPRLC